MKRRTALPTTKELRLLFTYKDGWLFWREDAKYGSVRAGDRAGFVSQDGYVRVGINGKSYMVHRIIWRLHNPRGAMPFILDHVDGDRSNNKIQNLRKVTHSENLLNLHRNAPRPLGTGRLKELLGV
jgi:hypothetical protein